MKPDEAAARGRRHVVIGTAGHVDHGKTALVQALTGIDTDRWEEEKRRGITIDLGFAHFDLDDEVQASVVDVPGHEDFVRNMVAGATGIDLALLVVAADEGVMPQTLEHLAILRYLDVGAGVVAITKADLVEEEWLELVREDIADRLGGDGASSGIAWEAPVAVSSKTGAGLDRLKAALGAAARRASAGDPGDLFRMPVDRVFSVAGAGTVVTGTTWSGTVAVGDEVRILPGAGKGRVRNVEVHGVAAPAALPGRRTALALAGVDREAVGRGSWVVKDRAWQATDRIDVTVSLLRDARPLTQRSRIRVHVGTAEVMARVTPADGEIGPGESGVARLRLESPVVCRWGDRGVLRSYSPVTTVGGCAVIDPWPERRPRRPPADPARRSADAPVRIEAFATSRGARGLAVADLQVRLGLFPGTEADALAALDPARVVRLGDHVVSAAVAAGARDAARAAVAAFHDAEPLKPGLPLEAFRRAAGGGFLADHARAALEGGGDVVVERGAVRLAEHTSELAGDQEAYGAAVQRALGEAGAQGIVAGDLDGVVPADQVVDIAEFFVRRNTAVRVGSDRYYDPGALRKVAAKTVSHLRDAGAASPADFREILGLSRKYLIPLLEWLDGQGITVRDGDVRRLGPKADTA